VIERHFDDLIHNRLPHISQQLHIPIGTLVEIIDKEIAPLDLHPGYRFFFQPMTAIIPDLHFISQDGKWEIEVNTSFLPHFQVAPIYADALKDHSMAGEEYFYLRRQLAGGKWLKRIVQRRNQTLRSIGELILKKQMAFFNGEKGRLVPMSMQDIAEELSLHESTVARAVANKFVACPHGLFSLKSFFSHGMVAQNGQKISKHSLRNILAKTIEKEDKLKPLSDEELTQHFRKLGLPCARRTIAKYRTALKIAPACKRRKWVS
jgi:RNA polymerase sigma-54 factor